MSLHRAAKRCDRGFVAPVLVAKAHIEMPFSDLLDSFSRQFGEAHVASSAAVEPAGEKMGPGAYVTLPPKNPPPVSPSPSDRRLLHQVAFVSERLVDRQSTWSR
jgi:hypothetical protein